MWHAAHRPLCPKVDMKDRLVDLPLGLMEKNEMLESVCGKYPGRISACRFGVRSIRPYTWTGYGVNVPGSSKCASYKMTINVTVAGDSVKAKFLQEGRTERHFEATKDAKGNFQTAAMLGGGNAIQVSGVINGPESKVLLDGYCKFGGPLLPK